MVPPSSVLNRLNRSPTGSQALSESATDVSLNLVWDPITLLPELCVRSGRPKSEFSMAAFKEAAPFSDRTFDYYNRSRFVIINGKQF
ncbi:hypothetical protein PRIPAC_97590 [Pristionchus pacificus]|uniref:Uncharacterized protein n=1 Tax=Pristionchus pacificus TaxID=54126 RepID=A0A2A6D1B4_PRIPA|nr:hypothetical protein PRIPAC_97590 [Pristionchus pacificus]|eukprot:PDM84282.1 hypothetical protein PRIPAC_33305 [Pristionchus pacificus]